MERCLPIRDNALPTSLAWKRAIAGLPDGPVRRRPQYPASRGHEKVCVERDQLSKGEKPFTGKLAHLPLKMGAFQDLAIHDMLPGMLRAPKNPLKFYADAAVVAYRERRQAMIFHSAALRSEDERRVADRPGLLSMLDDGDLSKSDRSCPSPAKDRQFMDSVRVCTSRNHNSRCHRLP